MYYRGEREMVVRSSFALRGLAGKRKEGKMKRARLSIIREA
jgi:hypothetical protein